MKIQYEGLAHISIVVEDIYKSVEFYAEHFGAIPLQKFANFSQTPFTKNLGFSLKKNEEADITTIYTIIPDINLYFELMQFHHPKKAKKLNHAKSNDLGVINHISFKVTNIDEIFNSFKKSDGFEFLNTEKNYKPEKLVAISSNEFEFFETALENDPKEKSKVCDIVSGIKFFIVKDFNGIHWEFEQGHSDIGG
jgi:maltose O-acetyltransferase